MEKRTARFPQSEGKHFLEIYYELRNLASFSKYDKLIGLEKILKKYDETTYRHSVKVARVAYKLAKMNTLSVFDCNMIYYCGLFHDIGKLFVTSEIVNRKTDLLSKNEHDLLVSHGRKGALIINRIVKLDDCFSRVCDEHWIGENKQEVDSDTLSKRHRYTSYITIADLIASSFDPSRQYLPNYRRRDVEKFIEERFDKGIFPQKIRSSFKKIMKNNLYLKFI